METKISKWTTPRGAKVEMHTTHVTEVPWYTDDFGTAHTKPADKIRIDKVIINDEEYTQSHLYGRIVRNGEKLLDLSEKVINGKKVRVALQLPADVEKDVWGEWDARQKAERERSAEYHRREQEEMAKKIANGYCTKCHSYCYGDCEAN